MICLSLQVLMPTAFTGLYLGEKNACNSIEVSLSIAVWSPRSSIGRFSADFNQFCIEPFLNLGIRNCTVQDTRLFDHKGIKVV